jgi:hypothetical protein
MSAKKANSIKGKSGEQSKSGNISIKAMKEFIQFVQSHPGQIQNTFFRWFRKSTHGDLPYWIIEKFEGETVHIHFFDFRIEAIEEHLQQYCKPKQLDFSIEFTDEILPEKNLCINKKEKPLLRLHDTSCSTAYDPYICVHLRLENDSLGLFLKMFRLQMCLEDLEMYRQIYSEKTGG